MLQFDPDLPFICLAIKVYEVDMCLHICSPLHSFPVTMAAGLTCICMCVCVSVCMLFPLLNYTTLSSLGPENWSDVTWWFYCSNSPFEDSHTHTHTHTLFPSLSVSLTSLLSIFFLPPHLLICSGNSSRQSFPNLCAFTCHAIHHWWVLEEHKFWESQTPTQKWTQDSNQIMACSSSSWELEIGLLQVGGWSGLLVPKTSKQCYLHPQSIF